MSQELEKAGKCTVPLNSQQRHAEDQSEESKYADHSGDEAKREREQEGAAVGRVRLGQSARGFSIHSYIIERKPQD